MLPKEVETLIRKNKSLKYDKETGKVICELSGHEMPCRVDIIKTYLSGKKFAKLQSLQCLEDETVKKHLVPSHKKGREHQLFCLLTLRHLNNRKDHIQKHLDGKRFQKALKKWEECQRAGMEYKPAGSRRKRQISDDREDNSDDEEEDDSDHDSLSDLFPAKDFRDDEEETEEASDFEFSDEDVEKEQTKSTKKDKGSDLKSNKRKQKELQPSSFKKKKKKKV